LGDRHCVPSYVVRCVTWVSGLSWGRPGRGGPVAAGFTCRGGGPGRRRLRVGGCCSRGCPATGARSPRSVGACVGLRRTGLGTTAPTPGWRRLRIPGVLFPVGPGVL